MASLMKKQAEKFLREKKRHRRWLALFLCLALLVTSGTFAALRMNGQAMDHGDRVLDCKLHLHEHTEECYDEAGKLVCGKADYVVHEHGPECYSSEGELLCTLEERKSHVHDSSCYEEQKVLVCGKEESPGHVHTQECYIEEKGEPRCGLGEHEHDESCYDGNGNIVCGQEVHQHTESCYTPTEVLVCGQEEGQDGHTHTDSCYKEEKVLTCGELELHTHDKETCYDENGDLICDIPELEEHVHGEGCFSTVEANAKMDGGGESSVSESDVSEENITKNGEFDNGVSENTVSGDSVSEDAVSGNSVSEDSISENKADVILETTAGGTTITLTGPAASFEEGKTYEIQAEAIKENSKQGKEIKEAIEETVETKEEVTEYRAFDIRLYSEGEEVQPVGPVSVNFASKDIKKSVADEETEVSIFHVDEETGKAEDMEAEPSEDGTVMMETTHFSIYVIVDKGGWGGGIEVELQHWGQNITTIDADGTTDPFELRFDNSYYDYATYPEKGNDRYGLYTKDEIYDRHNETISQNQYTGELYKADKIKLENELKDYSIENLSKIFQEMKDGKTPVDKQKYKLKKIWVSQKPEKTKDAEGEDKEQWEEGSYDEFLVRTDTSTNADGKKVQNLVVVDENDNIIKDPKRVTLSKNSVIRFWYEEQEGEIYEQSTTFYDYNLSVSDNKTVGKDTGEDAGVNKPENFKPETGTKMMVGQESSGNLSQDRNIYLGGFGYLQKGNYYGKGYTNNELYTVAEKTDQGTSMVVNENASDVTKKYIFGTSNWALPVPGLVKDTLKDNKLQFANGIRQPGFFEEGEEGSGKVKLDNYSLKFKRLGDTYTLTAVNNGTGDVLQNLEEIRKTAYNQWSRVSVYSNNFFPLDEETYDKDTKTDKGGDLQRNRTDKNGSPIKDSESGSDDGQPHNWHFGMHYTFTFTIGDYTGPMNYYFRGDDDFWLFVDGHKAVDLGGIHSAVGQAIDLRKFMSGENPSKVNLLENLNQEHRVDVYYMERGGHGSCCYMQFTLPNCQSVKDVVTDEHADVEVTKVWKGADGKELSESELNSRPSINVNLVRREIETGIETRETVTLNQSNHWYHKWGNLPVKNINNQKVRYEYYVEEPNVPDNYGAEITSADPVVVETKDELGNVTHTQTSYSYTITNMPREPEKTKVHVQKLWSEPEGVKVENIRPSEIQVQLRADGNIVPDTEITLSQNNKWEYTWTDLPKEKWTGKGYQDIVYKVEEINVPEGYVVTYGDPVVTEKTETEIQKTDVTITNKLDPQWEIIKRNKNNHDIMLSGAKFQLVSENGAPYYGMSNANGVIEWSTTEWNTTSRTVQDAGEGNHTIIRSEKIDVNASSEEAGPADGEEDSGPAESGSVGWPQEEAGPADDEADAGPGETVGNEFPEDTGYSYDEITYETSGYDTASEPGNDAAGQNPNPIEIAPGTYTLSETEAPAGYALSEETWTIVIGSQGELVSVTGSDNSDLISKSDQSINGGKVSFTFYYEDVVLYELPSTGGRGIYWYMFGGVLLMAAASLMTYRNKRREVLMR